ncbi:hypothetical protein BDV41DRAFT_552955 [Aspergillus transmontanensis]|uniref:Uncharacterized protein n=1 Tax=Aspergillus transmontanensis TaxID=1034304 RepID=A0A5N6VHZ5_9EURO|nr:hypothetical protein BDV41DRAFT_552955 [Aspergillus transmontanensis]
MPWRQVMLMFAYRAPPKEALTVVTHLTQASCTPCGLILTSHWWGLFINRRCTFFLLSFAVASPCQKPYLEYLYTQ